ncbi:tyrosine-type recombinase/integrase [Thiothrix nivea]|uniref:Integrase family protein n=1 Tax=Thiothrix nivea (strain ATCC 35100 / DSM 5205 / JP2) TaxID=870187 RepID=A0A656HIE3_THINJ|nr:integrase arm-type DNA-binding domain-containing protein [Thiothrix nivea]EIJ36217.1 integrase family protein [Thiothrix nivea DSM 5205]
MKRLLTDAATKNAKPTPDGKPKRYTDGGGLYLHVTSSGKYWRYNYRMDGKQKTLALGAYPDTSLKQAREGHQAARELLARGIDPSSHKQAAKGARLAEQANSFEAVALEWHVKFSADQAESHSSRNKRRLEKHVFPYVGGRIIGEIEPPDILAVLRKIEEAGTLETAHRVKTIISQVFRYAVATGRATRDQTADLKGALPPAKGKHFAAITDPQEVGELLRAMDDYRGAMETRIALQLSAYLFTRPGELRQMEWAEVDTVKAVWVIQAEKMKAGRVHVVPLCSQALALLEEMKPITGKRRYVFPSRTDTSKPMSNNTIRQALRRLGYDNDTMTAHGFRALASTRLYEMGFHSDLIEKQLAHSVGSEVRRAYDRSQHIEQRTAMMQTWADYLDSLRDGAQVIPFKRVG